MKTKFPHIATAAVFVVGLLIASSSLANAHCDSMNGPVVKAAKLALQQGDVTPVLRWVKKEYEEEVKQAFWKTLSVRTFNDQARDLADIYFFETVVRLHRAGEGAPYTGLKPEGTPVEPPVQLAEAALESGTPDEMIKKVTGHVAEAIRERFVRVLQARKNADRSVEEGRAYVEAYIEYVHFVEGIHNAVSGQGHHPEVSEVSKERQVH